MVAGLNTLASTIDDSVLDIAINPTLKSVQEEARRQHRYKRRTGKLERSISVETTPEGGEVYIEEKTADYGKYVHEGFGKWSPDQFLISAFERKLPALDAALDRAIDDSIKKAGL